MCRGYICRLFGIGLDQHHTLLAWLAKFQRRPMCCRAEKRQRRWSYKLKGLNLATMNWKRRKQSGPTIHQYHLCRLFRSCRLFHSRHLCQMRPRRKPWKWSNRPLKWMWCWCPHNLPRKRTAYNQQRAHRAAMSNRWANLAGYNFRLTMYMSMNHLETPWGCCMPIGKAARTLCGFRLIRSCHWFRLCRVRRVTH